MFTQERAKLCGRLIARADPGCMSKPRWPSAAAEETRGWPEKKHPSGEAWPSKIKHRGVGSKTPYFRSRSVCHGPLRRCLSTQLNFGNANGPMGPAACLCLCPQDQSLQARLLGLQHAALCPRALTASPGKAETGDLVCHFKDLYKLFSSPCVKRGLEKLMIIITF